MSWKWLPSLTFRGGKGTTSVTGTVMRKKVADEIRDIDDIYVYILQNFESIC